MERKTQVHAEPGRQDLLITRDFELPLELLFKAYSEAELFEAWMGTRVLQFEPRPQGSYRFETCTPQGIPVFQAHGVFHEFRPGQRITRTFEMDNASIGAQLEFLEFSSIDADHSRLVMHSIYRSAALRDEQLRQPFAYGINMAHDRLQQILRPQPLQS